MGTQKEPRRRTLEDRRRGYSLSDEELRGRGALAGKPLTQAEREQYWQRLGALDGAVEEMAVMVMRSRDAEFVSATWSDALRGKFQAVREAYAALDDLLNLAESNDDA